VLLWANGEAMGRTGAQAARDALAGEAVDRIEDCGDAGSFRVRARPVGDSRVVVSFEDASEARLSASILESLQEGLFVVDLEGRITRANQAAADLCGMSLGELVGSRLADLPIAVAPVRRALGGETVRGQVVRVERRDGTARSVEVNAGPLVEADGRPYGALGTYVDVTGRIEDERRIREEADTDHLTGLANRRALARMLAASLTRAASRGGAVGVLMLDLDGFKAINDALGHAAGDAALREVAERLRRSVRERDLVSRTGGDEFVIVLPDLSTRPGAAHEAADRIAAAFESPLRIEGVVTPLHAAVGVACYPQDGEDAAALMAAADRAMYARKGG
jgi:diguanylate cyclase (GGDEF)-like protein/PAS domain S-box-containing protein